MPEKAYEEYQAGNYESALRQYLELADEGNADCQVFVGWMYESGLGIPQDLVASGAWFRRAAELGSPLGAFYYARHLLKNGKKKESVDWFRKAASNSDIPSVFRLGHAYVHGVGIDQDITRGLNLLEEAAAKGHIFAMRALSILEIKGHKGFIKRFLGPIRFLCALVLGYLTAKHDPYSEKLRR